MTEELQPIKPCVQCDERNHACILTCFCSCHWKFFVNHFALVNTFLEKKSEVPVDVPLCTLFGASHDIMNDVAFNLYLHLKQFSDQKQADEYKHMIAMLELLSKRLPS